MGGLRHARNKCHCCDNAERGLNDVLREGDIPGTDSPFIYIHKKEILSFPHVVYHVSSDNHMSLLVGEALENESSVLPEDFRIKAICLSPKLFGY